MGIFIHRIRIVLLDTYRNSSACCTKLQARLFVFGPTCVTFRSPRCVRSLWRTLRVHMCVCVCVCHTVVSTPQTACSCMVYNGVRSGSFVRFCDRRREFFRFSSLHLRRCIRSLVKSLRPSEGERSSLKCTDVAATVRCAYRRVTHVSRQVPRLSRVAAFAVSERELLEPRRRRVARVDAHVAESLCSHYRD